MTDAAADEKSEQRNRREGVRFIVGFVLLFGALYGTLTYVPFAREYIAQPWTRAVAAVTAAIVQLFDATAYHSGTLVVGGNGGAVSDIVAFNVIDGCNGITPLSLLISGVVAFPTSWRARGLGLLIGIPAVLVINLLRILGLYAIRAYYPEWFDRSHLYVAQAFVILFTAGVWLWWLGRIASRPQPAEGG